MSDEIGTTLYFEDLPVGRRFDSGQLAVTQESIAHFAAEFGADAARAAAGTPPAALPSHISGVTMRLLADSSFRPAGGILGSGVKGLQWPTPVHAGDVLHLVSEIVGARRSQSKPDRGVVHVQTTTLNQRELPVQIMTATIMVPCREPWRG